MGIIQVFKNPVIVWFLVGIIMFLLELAIPALFFFFFGTGAWLVAIVLIFVQPSLRIQLILLVMFSIISLMLFRNQLRDLMQAHNEEPQ